MQPGATLFGTVGTEEDREAYEIALTMQDGTAVDTVAAGTYTLVIEESFEVTFQPGDYQYLCDPQPSMRGDLRVL